MLAPTGLTLLLALFDGHAMQVHIDGDDRTPPPLHQLPLVLQTVGWTLATAVLSLVLVLVVLVVLT